MLLLLAIVGFARAGPEIAPPVLERCPEVPYPDEVDAGAVQVDMVLELDGAGRVVAVREVDGSEPFATLAREAAARCRFQPALLDGTPIGVELPFSWTFPEPPARLEGVVRTLARRDPVAGLTVHVGEHTVTTDATGRFEADLPPGSVELRIVDPRYAFQPVTVDLRRDEAVALSLWVLPQEDPNEVVGLYDPLVQPQRRPLTREEVRAIPGSLGDPIRALHSRPGFARTPFDAGWLLVRGGDFDDTGTFLDGVRMSLLFHLGGFTSVLHPEMTETVRFWPGLQPPRFQALSGAVDVVPRAPGDDTRVVAGVNTVFAHAFAEAPLGEDAGIAFAARRSYLDGVLSLALDPERARIAPRFWDGQVQLRWGRTQVLMLALSDSFDAPSATDADLMTVTQNGFQLQARSDLPLGAGTLTFAPWFGIHGRALTGDLPEQRIIDRFPGLRLEWASGPGQPLRLLTGVEAQQRTWTLTHAPDTWTAPASSADPYVSVGAGDRVALETGVRLDTLFVGGHLPRAGLSPRASVRWRALDQLFLSAEVGRTHQPPLATLLVGVPEGGYLPLERVDSVAASMNLSHGAWSGSLSAYERVLAHLGAIERDGSINPWSGSARGVEADLHWSPGPLDLSVLYQIGRSTLREHPKSAEQPNLFDQTHRLELMALLDLSRQWTVSGRFRYASGFPRLLDVQPPVPSDAYDLLTQRLVDLQLPPDARRLAPFHALDLKVARTVTFRTWELDFWLDLQNVYHRRVVEPLVTGFATSEPTYGFGLPILPVFGVEGRFWP